MKFRTFELKDDITQIEYVNFRAGVQSFTPPAWNSFELLPIELFYDVMVRAAIDAKWLLDVVEENEYNEETVWEWSIEYIDSLKAGSFPLLEWGEVVFNRWAEIKTLDPN
jgi:hypothetical protein